jgi:hypothetical protein
MAGGLVDHIEVRKFLSRTPRLRSFAFNFECKWHGCGSDWDAGAFMAAVEDEVGDTLEKLSLTIVWVLDGTTGIKSMKKSRKLTEVVICTQSESYSDFGPNEAGSGSESHEAREASSNSGQDLSVRTCRVSFNMGGAIDGEAQSTGYSTRQQWRRDLESLGSSANIRFVKTPPKSIGGTVQPYFMRNFCDRYGVEMTY